jgi:pimeloyl-ACP methyl ester carboxylesterase
MITHKHLLVGFGVAPTGKSCEEVANGVVCSARERFSNGVGFDLHDEETKVLKTIQTETLEIAVEDRGQAHGKSVILLHGFPDDPRSWDGVVEPLTAAGFRTLAPYLRGFGPTRFLDAHTLRSGQQGALAYDLNGLIDGLKLQQPILVGYDWGARAACTVSALWPAKIAGLVSIGGYNIEDMAQDQEPASARREYGGWYQWYFHTKRGKAGLEKNRREICRLLWELWSPNLRSVEALFNETAPSFDNPDFVEIVVHSYRHRYGAAAGDQNLQAIEQKLAGQPKISVPTIVLHGEGDGVHPPALSEGQEKHFSAHFERRLIPTAGHLFPREAPDAVVSAIKKLSGLPNHTGNRHR